MLWPIWATPPDIEGLGTGELRNLRPGSLSAGANKSRRLIYATATATAKAKIFEKRVFRFLMAAHKFQH